MHRQLYRSKTHLATVRKRLYCGKTASTGVKNVFYPGKRYFAALRKVFYRGKENVWKMEGLSYGRKGGREAKNIRFSCRKSIIAEVANGAASRECGLPCAAWVLLW